MGKKSKRTRSSKEEQGQGQGQEQDGGRLAPNQRSEEVETADNLKFQDPFVDEIEPEDVVDDDDDDDDEEMEEGMNDVVGSGTSTRRNTLANGIGIEADDDGDDVELVQSWHPLMGVPLDQDQELEMDPSAYKMYHTLSPEWPSLSFDFLRDDLGDARQRFPHSLQAVIGTQVSSNSTSPENNQLTVLKLSDLSKLPQVDDADEDILGDEYDKDDDDDESNNSSDEEEEVDLDPILEHHHIPHYGGVNRIRAMPQQSDIVATWSDVGKVYLYNIQGIRSRFLTGNGKNNSNSNNNNKNNHSPFFTHAGHGVEGYALDWSLQSKGHLVTGDNDGMIHTWMPREDGCSYDVTPSYESLGGVSVEDLQWSPTEATVFLSGESGGHVAIYDTRAPNRAMLRHLVHETTKADVNVTSWNSLVSNLLATGGDDGTLSVWDLRQFSAQKQTNVTPLARFSCHQTPITSVEWHPTDESMLAVSDTVGSYIYDLSVEEDEETATAANNCATDGATKSLVADIPPQLLFCHSGSRDFKELHWHPQISSCIMTTALTGFSIFCPSNL